MDPGRIDWRKGCPVNPTDIANLFSDGTQAIYGFSHGLLRGITIVVFGHFRSEPASPGTLSLMPDLKLTGVAVHSIHRDKGYHRHVYPAGLAPASVWHCLLHQPALVGAESPARRPPRS